MHNIFNYIDDVNIIGIAGHVRPDGDCIGSCMALYHYIKKNHNNKIIHVYLETIPDRFLFIKDTDLVKQSNDDKIQYDLFISLDSSNQDRLGIAEASFNNAKLRINIDHHISNTNFGDINHVKFNESSTCEVLYHIFDDDKIDYEVAQALYLGIIHDTGIFKHSNTTQETMKVAGKLIAKGIPFSKIIDDTFYLKNYNQNQILGRCLLESMLCLDGKCIVSSVSKKMMDFYSAKPSDLEGIIDQLRITEGIEVALFLYEIGINEYKVSMRSNNDVDVSKIAVFFGGGGHIKAAGCTMYGTMHDVINNLTAHIDHQIKSNS